MNILEKVRARIKKQKEEEENGLGEQIFAPIDLNLIPFASQIESDCIITKDGQIFKIIEIKYSDEQEVNIEGGFRDKVREAISSENDKNLDLSFYTYTYRDPDDIFKNLKLTGTNQIQKDIFDTSIGAKSKINKNTTIFSIFIFCPGLKISFSSYVSNYLIKNKHDSYIKEKYKELSVATDSLMLKLKEFKPAKLSTYEEGTDLISQMLSSINYLMNFERKKIPLQKIDISQQLTFKKEYSFGNTAIGIKFEKSEKYIAILSIKSISDLSINAIKNLIASCDNIVIKEFFCRIDNKSAKEHYKDILQILKISQQTDENEKKIYSTIDESNRKDHCVYSCSIMIAADSYDDLDYTVVKLAANLCKKGILFAKEDVKLTTQFLSSIPGNFNFITRVSPEYKKNVPAFAYSKAYEDKNTEDQKMFALVSSVQKNPVMLLYENVRPNIVINSELNPESRKLIGFLCTNLQRTLNAKVVIVDFTDKLETYAKVTGMKYANVSKNIANQTCKINIIKPFKEDNLHIFKKIIQILSKSQDPKIEALCKKISGLKTSKTNLSDVTEIMPDEVKVNLKQFCDLGLYHHMFDSKDDIFNNDEIAFNVSEIEDLDIELAFVLYTIYSCIDRKKSQKINTHQVVVINKAFQVFSNKTIKSHINEILDECKENKIILIFCGPVNNLVDTSIITSMLNYSKNIFFTPNKALSYQYSEIFGITRDEFELIKMSDDNTGKMALKTKDFSIFTIPITKIQEFIFNDNFSIKCDYLKIKQSLGSKNEYQDISQVIQNKLI